MHSVPKLVGSVSSSEQASGVHVPVPNGLYTSVGTLPASTGLAPQAVYNGGFTGATEVCVRIANGGAGQSGLIGAWANAFIQYAVSKGKQPFLVSNNTTVMWYRGLMYDVSFQVAWYLGDTTESLGLLDAGSVDTAVTYNEAAEMPKIKSGAAIRREYGFRVCISLSV